MHVAEHFPVERDEGKIFWDDGKGKIHTTAQGGAGQKGTKIYLT